MGRPCAAKNFKNRTSDFLKKKSVFQICALSYRPQGTHQKVLHGCTHCTTAFFLLYKSI